MAITKTSSSYETLSYSSQCDRCAYYSLWGFRLDYDYESSVELDSEALCYRKLLIGLTIVCYVMCNVVLLSPPLASALIFLFLSGTFEL